MSNKQHTRGWSLAAKMEYHSIPEPNNGCLLWLGDLSGDYPCTSVQGKRREVHRAVLELKLGRSLLPGARARQRQRTGAIDRRDCGRDSERAGHACRHRQQIWTGLPAGLGHSERSPLEARRRPESDMMIKGAHRSGDTDA